MDLLLERVRTGPRPAILVLLAVSWFLLLPGSLQGQPAPTDLSVNAATGTFGGTVELVATLSTGPGSALSCSVVGQQIDFTLNGMDAGSASTDLFGVATHTAALADIDAGTYPGGSNSGVAATFKGDSPRCRGSQGGAGLVVNKASQVIAWSNPVDISVDTPLGATQLNATLTTGDGVLTYDPPAGTLLPIGIHLLQVTAGETTNYEEASAEVSITVVPGVAIITVDLPNGVVGSLYSLLLEASGGIEPYQWSLTQGELPLWLTLDPATGLIQGTPGLAGTFPFTVRVSDSSATSFTADRMFEISVQSGPTNLSVNSATGTFSGAVELVAALDVVSFPNCTPAGHQIDFTLNGMDAGSASTDLFGVATHTASLASIDAGTYPGGSNSGVGASFGGVSSQCGASNATAELVVNKASQVIAWSNPVDISVDTPLGATQLNATLTTGDGVLTYDPPAGTLLPIGIHLLQVTAAETTNYEEASAEVSITVVPGVAIITVDLPNGVVGSLYSLLLEASGGIEPYQWSLTQGELPVGITLDPSTGSIQGTPGLAGTFPFTVRVSDSSTTPQTAVQMFDITVADLPLDPPLVTVTGIQSTLNPAAQLEVGLSLSQPSSTPVSGTLTLAFEPDAVTPSDDPMLRFSNGSRSVAFEFAANSTTASLVPPVSLLTGTVSGSIRLTISTDSGLSNIQVGSATIPRLPPRISNVMVSELAGSGLEIGITGYSTERSVATATFTFTVRNGTGVQQFPLTRSVEEEFNTWYQSPTSEPFGSTFLFLQSFIVQGDAGTLESVTVRLANGEGTTSSAPIFLSSP